jgi:hypothetical protein
MSFGGVLVHRLGRLRAPIAIGSVEVKGADAMFAGGALESDATIHGFGCVMSHNVIVASYSQSTSGHWVYDLRVGSQQRGEAHGRGKTSHGQGQTGFRLKFRTWARPPLSLAPGRQDDATGLAGRKTLNHQ